MYKFFGKAGKNYVPWRKPSRMHPLYRDIFKSLFSGMDPVVFLGKFEVGKIN